MDDQRKLAPTELKALERAEQVAEFVRLSEEVRQAALAPVEAQQSVTPQAQAAHVAPPQKRYEQRRNRLAARDLGLSRDEVRRARTIAALSDMAKAKAANLGLDRNQAALLEAAKAPTRAAQISTLERRAVRTVAPLQSRPSPLRNLENIAAGTLAKWIKETTPNDRLRVIDVLRRCADYLADEMKAERAV
jgi:hypothetical protein